LHDPAHFRFPIGLEICASAAKGQPVFCVRCSVKADLMKKRPEKFFQFNMF